MTDHVRMGAGSGYDSDLPSLPPFMFVENHQTFGDLGVISFGAYNAFGLIGSEKGGVAIVLEKPSKAVLATKDIPWDPPARARELNKIVSLIQRYGGTDKKSIPDAKKPSFVDDLIFDGYDVRA